MTFSSLTVAANGLERKRGERGFTNIFIIRGKSEYPKNKIGQSDHLNKKKSEQCYILMANIRRALLVIQVIKILWPIHAIPSSTQIISISNIPPFDAVFLQDGCDIITFFVSEIYNHQKSCYKNEFR